MTKPDLPRYLLAGDPAGVVLTLRGHATFVPKLMLILGVVALLGGAVGVYGIVTSPGDPIPLGIGIAGTVLGLGSIVYARRRLAHPDRTLVIDKPAQTLTIRSGHAEPTTLAFADLGPLKLGKITALVVDKSSGLHERTSHAAIGLSRHPGVVLYEPWNDDDLKCFVVTLRDVIGEEFLPRAQPKPEGTAS